MKRRLKQKTYQIISIIGDGAMTGGLAYEGLNNLGYHRTQLTVVLNDNSLSIFPFMIPIVKYESYIELGNIFTILSGMPPIFVPKEDAGD